MQQNPTTTERKKIEVIVGLKPELGETAPEKATKLGEKPAEVGGRSAGVYVESPYTGNVYYVYLDYEGQWFTETLSNGQTFSFRVWY
jgi:hypothetical protein